MHQQSLTNLLQISFIDYFGVSQDKNGHEFDNIYKQIERIMLQNSCLNLLVENTAGQLRRDFKNIQSSFYSYPMPGWGSMVIIHKKVQEYFPSLVISFPTQWKLGITPKFERSLMYPSSSSKYQHLYIGQVREKNAYTAKNKIKQKSEAIIKIMESKNHQQKIKNHHTPSWLAQALSETLYVINNDIQIDQQQSEKIRFYSKGGTLDVGKHTGITMPQVDYPIVWSYINFVMQNQQLTIAWELAYRIALVEIIKFDEAQTAIKMKHISKCLQYIRGQLQYQVGCSNGYINISQIQKVILKIYLKISREKPVNIKSFRNFGINQKNIKKFFNSSNYSSKYALQQFTKLKLKLSPKDTYIKCYLFKSLLNLSKQNQQQWIMKMQDTVFTLCVNQLKKQFPFQMIIQDSGNRQGWYMTRCLFRYCQLQHKRIKQRPILLEAQIYSHIQLMKCLISCIGFQVFRKKLNQQPNLFQESSDFSVEQYRIPNQVNLLFEGFNSISYKARRAMKSLMKYYKKQKHKKPFFFAKQGDKNFRQYALKVVKNSSYYQNQAQYRIKQLKQEQNQMKSQLNRFHSQKNSLVQKVNYYKRKNCQCYWSYGNKHQCSRCESLEQYQNILKKHLQQKKRQIQAIIPSSSVKIHSFFQYMNLQLQNLVQILIFAQYEHSKSSIRYSNSKIPIRSLLNTRNLTFKINLKKTHQFALNQYSQNTTSSLIKYAQPSVSVQWSNQQSFQKDFSQISSINQTIWTQNKELKTFFLDSDYPNDPTKEHLIYSNQSSKPNNYNYLQYVNISTIRTGIYTQIPLLLQKIEKRSIQINPFLTEGIYSLQIIWKSLASYYSEADHIYYDPRLNVNLGIEIKNQIQQFFDTYMKTWSSDDFQTLPILGCVFSLLNMILTHHKQQVIWPLYYVDNQLYEIDLHKPNCHSMFRTLLQKILLRYNNIEDDLKRTESSNKDVYNQNCTNQLFICFGGLCCLCQPIISPKDGIAVQMVSLIAIMYFKQIFTELPEKYQQIFKNYRWFKNKAIQNNIDNCVIYFLANLSSLNHIISLIYEGIRQDTQWKHTPQIGYYTFYGTDSQNIYQINIKTGQILINGSAAIRVPQKIKNCQHYKTIFGDRDFQIFRTRNGMSYEARKDFRNHFIDNVRNDDCVLFRFSLSEKQQNPLIFKVIKYKQIAEQQVWQLIQSNQALQRMCIPLVYAQNYYMWSCKTRRCIFFRKKKLEKMCETSLVVFVQSYGFINAKRISSMYLRQSVKFLSDPKNEIFDQVILQSQNEKSKKDYFQALSIIENQKYIIQIKTIHNQEILWLHRFKLKFLLQSKKLIPVSFRDYQVSLKPHYHQLVPFDKYPIIVLTKFQNSQQSISSHKYKIIVPDHPFDAQDVQNARNSLSDMLYYILDIHDHTFKIIGTNRQAQMFITAVLLKTNNGNYHPELHLTNQLYSLKTLSPCFNNLSLTNRQMELADRIIYYGLKEKFWTIILMTHALILMSKQLISYQPSSQDVYNVYQQKYMNKKYVDFIAKCKSSYNMLMKRGTLPLSQKLPKQFQQIIGIRFGDILNYNNSSPKIWMNKFPLIPKQKTNKDVLDSCNQALDKYQTLKQQLISSESNRNDSSEQITVAMKKKKDNNNLRKQMDKQLQESYEAYMSSENYIKGMNFQRLVKSINKLQDMLKLFEQLQNSSKNQLLKVFKSNEYHIDVICGYRPLMSWLDSVSILLQKSKIKQYFPHCTQQVIQQIYVLLKVWARLVVQINSLKRLLFYYSKYEINDKIVLLRQLQSPRRKIQSHLHWVCFQVQMKIQIWSSQFQTYSQLFKNSLLPNGDIQQLNMGEGKTQVIIPLIILEVIYETAYNKKITPRINLLTSIFQQSKINYFRFLSITSFNIPIICIPFRRQVKVNDQRVLGSIQRMIRFFNKRMALLIDQTSLHSIILKLRECSYQNGQGFQKNKQKIIFKNLECLDIFDEVDAMMVPKKSFIYSIGKISTLNQLIDRTKVCEILIDATCKLIDTLNKKGYIVFDENIEKAQQKIMRGEFPRGLRFIAHLSQDLREGQANKMHRIILSYIFAKQNRHQILSFLSQLKQKQIITIKNYILEDKLTFQESLKTKLSTKAIKVIFCFRGMFAYGIFKYCMTQRCQIKYGIPDQQRVIRSGKQLAVPYQAANIPSKRNDFAQPDVALFFTILAYYNCGVPKSELRKGIQMLFQLSKGNKQIKNMIYQEWYSALGDQMKKYLKIQNGTQINIDSESQMQRLFVAFRNNVRFISFWLLNCILVRDMGQYQQSITSSSWDHSCVQTSVGFSGTKDMHRLFPKYITYKTSINQRIRGTDGFMIQMLYTHTLDIQQIIVDDCSMWQRFVMTCINYKKSDNISCIIDVGALLGGASLRDDIIPWMAQQKFFTKKKYFQGISFCFENQWSVYDFNTMDIIARNTSVPDDQTFVIFDEYRTRGADFKMNCNAVGIISLGLNLTKDSLMQAIGRLRKFGRNQKIIFVISQEIKYKLTFESSYRTQDPLKRKIQAILDWVCNNSQKQNEKYMLENSKLALIHLKNKQVPFYQSPITQKIDTSLQNLYEQPLSQHSIHQMSMNLFKQIETPDKQLVVEQILKTTQYYGQSLKIKSQNYDQVKERQSQLQQQKQKQKQNQLQGLSPIRQEDEVVSEKIQMKKFVYKFDRMLKYSKNFKQCTNNGMVKNMSQLALGHFVRIRPTQICIITVRQANALLYGSNIQFFNPSKIQHNYNKQYVARISDLDISTRYICKNNLSGALVHCKLFNAQYIFSQKEVQILKELFRQKDIDEDKLTYFLRERKCDNLYRNSSLEKVFNDLAFMHKID